MSEKFWENYTKEDCIKYNEKILKDLKNKWEEWYPWATNEDACGLFPTKKELEKDIKDKTSKLKKDIKENIDK